MSELLNSSKLNPSESNRQLDFIENPNLDNLLFDLEFKYKEYPVKLCIDKANEITINLNWETYSKIKSNFPDHKSEISDLIFTMFKKLCS